MRILILLLSTLTLAMGQTTWPAATASYADVLAAYDLSSNGDTVTIPAGTAEWTQTLNVTKGITLQGSGSGATIIQDGCPFGNNPVIRLTTTFGLDYHVTGIEFQKGPSRTTSNSWGVIGVLGDSQTVRLSYCFFNDPMNIHVRTGQEALGVSDHNYHYTTRGANQFYQLYLSTWNDDVWGDGSWSSASTKGTAQNWYVEDCVLEGDGTAAFATDFFGGCRFVGRFNELLNANWSSHGTGDGSGRNRGPRHWEFYHNVMTASPGGVSEGKNACHIRGGTGMYFNNDHGANMTKASITLHTYRYYAQHGHFSPIGAAWDERDLTDGAGTPGGAGDSVFDAGTATSGTVESPSLNVLVDTSKSWTTDEWVNYVVIVATSAAHPDGQFASVVQSNDATSITVTPGTAGYVNKPFVTGEGYEIVRVVQALDQVGTGQADFLADKDTTPNLTPIDLNQGVDPVYMWGNMKGGSPISPPTDQGGGEPWIIEDIYWFVEKSGFDGTSGMGIGTAAQMAAITPTTLNVGFWVTNEGTWNTANDDPTPTFDGRLYQWDGAVWALSYTPYTYPHPLVSGDPPPPADTAPPLPDPPTFASAPAAAGSATIIFAATAGSDATLPVQYRYRVDGGTPSAWQGSESMQATGLTPATEYDIEIQMRDSSVAQNETGWSAVLSATTNAAATAPPATVTNLIITTLNQ